MNLFILLIRKEKISPYDAWYNDKLLKKVIKNRIIYQTYLNPNKILQGFNISKIAKKISVFSAGRAKMIIDKFLSEYDTIFDPFSGFSGRMLGAISAKKKYIGQDISPIHVRESNNLLNFLKERFADIDTKVIEKDIFQSTGKYECLFMMDKIVTRAEVELLRNLRHKGHRIDTDNVADSVSRSATHIVDEIKAAAVIPLTRSGSTASKISKYRPRSPIIAQ